jgi:hypothetical protein
MRSKTKRGNKVKKFLKKPAEGSQTFAFSAAKWYNPRLNADYDKKIKNA